MQALVYLNVVNQLSKQIEEDRRSETTIREE
jgi:hypothetical protein